MKKMISLLLVLALCLGMVGCGRPKCSVEGCENKSEKRENPEVLLCLEHTCGIEGCEAAAVKEVGLCPAHTCSVEGCTVKIMEGEKMCREHRAFSLCQEAYRELCTAFNNCQGYNMDLQNGLAAADAITAGKRDNATMLHTSAVNILRDELSYDADVAQKVIVGAYVHNHFNTNKTEMALEEAFYDLLWETAKIDDAYPIGDLRSFMSHYDLCWDYQDERDERLEGMGAGDALATEASEIRRLVCEGINIYYLEDNGPLRQACDAMMRVKSIMDKLERDHSSYTHLQNLKKFYLQTNHYCTAAAALAAYITEDAENAVNAVGSACSKFDNFYTNGANRMEQLSAYFSAEG